MITFLVSNRPCFRGEHLSYDDGVASDRLPELRELRLIRSAERVRLRDSRSIRVPLAKNDAFDFSDIHWNH